MLNPREASAGRKSLTKLTLAVVVLLAAAPALHAQNSERVVSAAGYSSVDGVKPGNKFRIAVELKVSPGYHINAHVPSLDYLKATIVTFDPLPGIRLSEPQYPAPVQRTFEFAETPLAVHEGVIAITSEAEADRSLQPGPVALKGRVQVQACNDSLCLAPADIPVEIALNIVPATSSVKEINGEVFSRPASSGPTIQSADTGPSLVQYKGTSRGSDPFSAALSSGGTLSLLGVIFVSGLLLNLTPCVYPIIPITIGFFVNQGGRQGERPNIRRTFGMAAMYVFGMGITYSLLGVIAAKSGGLFGAALQKPPVLIGLALLMLALSLSMFGVYEFKLPESLNRFANTTTQSTSGVLGALVMGLTMGIVAAPCIGPFVIGLLVHVGARGDALYGFFLFFVLAMGLGLPYLFLGTFSGALKALPRSGLWMVAIRKVFGVVLIGMALYFLAPLLGDYSRYAYILFFGIAALYLFGWEASRTKPKQFGWALRVIGFGSAVVAVMLAMPRRVESQIPWQPYSERAVEQAKRDGKNVIIDTFADWCIPCKELDQNTFTDARIKAEAEKVVPLKLDLTQQDSNSEAGRARARYAILGVPTVIFIDASGQERADLRLEGFEKPAFFLNRIQKLTAGAREISTSAAVKAAPTAEGPAKFDPAPNISLNLLTGDKLDLVSLRGKVVLVDFWATWCLPCISEIPSFNELKRDYSPRGVEIIAISLDAEGAAKVRPFVKEHKMDYTQALGDSATATAFDVDESKLPVTLVIDKQGRVRYRHVGITKKEEFERELSQLLGE